MRAEQGFWGRRLRFGAPWLGPRRLLVLSF